MAKELSLQKFQSLSDLVTIEPGELSDADALAVWSLFDAIEKKIVKERKATFREYLMDLAVKNGMVNAKGSYEYNPPGSDGKITKSPRKAKPIMDYAALEKKLEDLDLLDQANGVTVTLSESDFDEIVDVLDRNGAKAMANVMRNSSSKPAIVDDRVEALVATGALSLDTLEEVSLPGDVTYQMRVKAPSIIAKLIEGRK